MSNYSYKDYYLTNLTSYYRDHKDYLSERKCCKKSKQTISNISTLGSQRCCSNKTSNYYKSYGDFLSDKKCCSSIILFDAYKKYLK
jgi:hypothetical protein